MSEREGYGEETFGEPERVGEARKRGRELRAQAELAWDRVQRVIRRGQAPPLSTKGLLEAIEQVPTETYVAGIAASLLGSAWLHAVGRRSAGTFVGLAAPLAFGLALALKSARQSRKM